jgi:hypothetical protein
MSSCGLSLRLDWRTADASSRVWICPAGEQAVRFEVDNEGACRMLGFATADLGLHLVLEAGLQPDRVALGDLEAEFTLAGYRDFIANASEGSAAGREALQQQGVAMATAERLVGALASGGRRLTATCFRAAPDAPSGVAVGMMSWIDLGDTGLVRVETPSYDAIEAGLTGGEKVRLSATNDETIYNGLAALLGGSPAP